MPALTSCALPILLNVYVLLLDYVSLFIPMPVLRSTPHIRLFTAFSNHLLFTSRPRFILMVTTRTKSYNYERGTAELECLSPTSEPLSDRRQKWAHLLHSQHYQPLISEVLDEELPKYEHSVVINLADHILHARDCALILASAPSVLAAAVNGDLVGRMLSDRDLQREYAPIHERAHHQPSIYIHLLADGHGTPPTPNQYLAIRDTVLDYMAAGFDSKHAWHLDNITHPTVTKQASGQGHRKYLQTKNRSAKRVETLQRFCQGVQKRWLETPASLRNTPFQHPPGECGYSKDSHVRLAQHRAHQSSNYLMNLVEDICTHLHRTGVFKQHFTMHQFIIYLIFRPNQAAIAEIFCSGLLQVWVENGGGFNAYPAGRSVATARRVSTDEWVVHERRTRQESPVLENMRQQQHRADEWRKALEWDEEAVADSDMTEPSVDENEYDCIVHREQLSV
ncbi:hypothetical protein EJ02DRAFT_178305 [Clathrospora elynae]|uniref:Uncharacterized protein n=1 Tax=Clathrospora elynae TaxID=706981 RepID=A0A6A5SR15_9PLEO|nr:hypothetical protein EJ02DRAFT_178305 [Clathrospora elynae]